MFVKDESVERPAQVERRSGGDRRQVFRGGRRAADLARAAAAAGVLPLAVVASLAVPGAQAPQSRTPRDTSAPTGRKAVPRTPPAAPSDSAGSTPAPAPAPVPEPAPVNLPRMRFGVPVDALAATGSRGVDMNFGVFWTGAWTQKHGWGYAEENLEAARRQGITPVVHWWYWGDDISPACVERGCDDKRQGVWKDRATWYRMTRELAGTIRETMGGAETIVIVETEFNKGGIEGYEPFDGYLLDQIVELRRVPGVKVVVGFGNWGLNNWPRFNRAAAAADYVGTQLLRSSVRDAATYQQAVDTLVSGAAHLRNTFRKPSLVIDLALSSYPSATYEAHQAAVVTELFSRLGELKSLGVTGIVWRAMADDPAFDTSNYHGVAERHWGFIRADGSAKPALRPFIDGIRREGLN